MKQKHNYYIVRVKRQWKQYYVSYNLFYRDLDAFHQLGECCKFHSEFSIRHSLSDQQFIPFDRFIVQSKF